MADAQRLYDDLIKIAASPWMDKHRLEGGSGWKGAIKRAIRESSHFLPLISRHSVRKRGYMQREVLEALDYLKEFPPDEIYVIPIRLDDTLPLHEQLQALDWIDLFPSYDVGFARLREVLQGSGGAPITTSSIGSEIARDTERLGAYRQLFDRAAFRMPCIFEYALTEVEATIDRISAAIATGSVYSRDGVLLSKIPTLATFETATIRNTLETIRDDLQMTKRVVSALMRLLARAVGTDLKTLRESYFHMEFLLEDIAERGPADAIILEALNLMDDIDRCRNTILRKLNDVFAEHGIVLLPYVTLSREQIRLSAELEEGKGLGPQRWHEYYLRTHKSLQRFLPLAGTSSSA